MFVFPGIPSFIARIPSPLFIWRSVSISYLPMVLHVEILGLPGSGKTTVRHKLCGMNHPAVLAAEEAYKIALCRLVYPSCSWSVCRYVPQTVLNKFRFLQPRLLNTPATERHREFYSVATNAVTTYTDDDSRQTTVATWLERLVQEYDAISRTFSPADTVIFDEGFLQRSLSLFCPPHPTTTLQQKHVQEYVSTMPTPALIVVLDVSVEVSRERMASRENGVPSSYTHLSQVQLQQSLNRMQTYINHVTALSRDADIPLVRIENERQVESTVQQIHQVLPQPDR